MDFQMRRPIRSVAVISAAGAAAFVMASSLGLSAQGGAAPAQTAAAPTPASTAAASYVPPRTPWGHPDLQGIYSNDDETGTPMARPAQFAGRTLDSISAEEMAQINRQRNEQFNAGVAGTEFAGGLRPPTHLIFDTFERKNRRAWLIVDPPDGQQPPRVDGRAGGGRRGGGRGAAAGRGAGGGRGISTNANPNGPFYSWLDMGLYDRCITRGLPGSMMPAGYGSRYDITQSPDSVVIRYEMVHEARVIPLDGRSPLPEGMTQYMGDARGRWEGETLVVETRNFRPDTAPQGASERATMIERFRSTAPDIVEWSVTIDDPTVWTRPWTFSMPLTRVGQDQQVVEYACHEGNHAMRNILSAQRAAEREAAGTSGR
jgi:hypothetical protein